MNDIQENRLGMINKTCSYLDNNAAALASVPSVATAATALKAKRDEIIDANEEAIADTTGTAENKQNKRTALTDAILLAGASVESYAVDIDDPDLRRLVNYNKSELDLKRDYEILGIADLVYKTTEPLVPSLGAYAYTATELTAFDTARNAYRPLVTKPKEKIEGKARAGKVVDDLFDDADVILDKTDTYLKIFRFAPGALYFGYLLARRIDDNTGPGGGGGGGGTGTVFTGPVNAMSFATVPVTYNAVTPVLLENPGTTTLFYQLYLNGFSSGNQKQIDPAGSDTFLMGEWAANGNEIRIYNNSAAATGTYKITLG
jgi:hypothetical protein